MIESRQNASPLRNSLETDSAVIYSLDQDLKILHCNEAWDRFAQANGGRGLEREGQIGKCILDAIPPVLKPFFQKHYSQVLITRQPWEHCYECSSVSIYRSFRMVVYPNPETDGVVVVNSSIVERPNDVAAQSVDLDAVVHHDDHGFIDMCCQCRRVRRRHAVETWDWVPAYIEQLPTFVTHGICIVCMNLIYPTLIAP